MQKNSCAAESCLVECRAKINLAIDVVGHREDGYHLVEMVMQEIPLWDDLTVTLRQEGNIRLLTDVDWLPAGRENLAYRAAEVLMKHVGYNQGVDLRLVKRIPAGSGLGGGSADAAGVLKGLNRLLGQPCTREELMELAVTIGADVPFCISGGCALAEGIGEVLTPLNMPPQRPLVIAKPQESASTPWVYQNLDENQKPDNLCVQAVAEGARRGDWKMICSNAGNILESVIIPAFPVVGRLKQIMMDNGACLSMMSGSGTAVFGVFETRKRAECAGNKLKILTREVYVI